MNRKHPWDPEHEAYLLDLVELAMRQLNRDLGSKDFAAITDALHRKFQPDNVTIPYRGTNAVHSFAGRHELLRYKKVRARVFGQGN